VHFKKQLLQGGCSLCGGMGGGKKKVGCIFIKARGGGEVKNKVGGRKSGRGELQKSGTNGNMEAELLSSQESLARTMKSRGEERELGINIPR